DDAVERRGFADEDISTAESALAALRGRSDALVRDVLAGQREERRAVRAGEGRGEGGRILLGVARPDNVKVRDEPQAADRFHRLVGRAVLADADAVVRED